MPFFQLPAQWWKCLIVALALTMAALVACEASYGVRTALHDEAVGDPVGYTGIDMLDRFGAAPDGEGTYEVRVEEPASGSPLANAGVHRGDIIRFDRPLDRWRVFHGQEKVKLTVLRSERPCAPDRHASVRPDRSAIPCSTAGTSLARRTVDITAAPGRLTPMALVDYWGRFAISVLALLFAVLVALRKPLGHGYRCLSLMFLALGSSFFYSFTLAPPGPIATLSKIVQLTVYDLILFFYLGFVMHYQAYPPTRLRRALRAIAGVYRAAALGGAAFELAFALGVELPFLAIYTRALLGGAVTLALLSLYDGWRCGVGNARQRHLWLIGALGLGSVPAFLTTLPFLQALGLSFSARMIAFFVGQIAMYALLLYATLKHRVFDFGYVMGRLAVKSLSNILLVVAFLVLEWMVGSQVDASVQPVHGSGVWTHVLEATPAIVTYLVFQLAHRRIEHGIQHVLLRRWESNKAQLRAYVAAAGQISSTEVLLDSLLAELDRFSEQAGAAVYQRRRDGDFALAAATLAGAPDRYGSNHELVVTLCSDQAPVRTEPLAVAGIDLVLPMVRRGELLGFVLLGCKNKGESYRPDEVDILGWAICQVGLDLRTLHVSRLERTLRTLEERNTRRHQDLLAMLGRRSLQGQAAGLEGAG